MSDPINKPAHYVSESGLEAIDVIEAFHLGFNRGNAIKYVLRAGLKSADIETDLRKAIWYLEREIKNIHAKEQAAKLRQAKK